MMPLVLSDRGNHLEINFLGFHDQDTPLPTALIAAAVSSSGYCGGRSANIEEESFRQFCSQLTSIQRYLRGEARLESMSPGELSIKISPVNGRGYFSVEGIIGAHICDDGIRSNWNAVQFGFTLEPKQLIAVKRVPWVEENAV